MAKLFSKKKETPGELPEEHKRIRAAFDHVYNSEEYKTRRKNFERWLKRYGGELWPDDLNRHESKIQVNFIFANIQSMCPLLTDNRPIWHMRARDPMYQNMANIYGKALEYLWDVLEMDNNIFLVEKDALLYGTGILKTFWNVEEDEVETEVIDPATFVIAPGYDDIWKSAWCGEKVRKPLTWFKMNYPDKFDQVKPEEEDPQQQYAQHLFDLEKKTATVYQIWVRDPTIEEYFEEISPEFDSDGTEVKPATKEKKTRKKYPNGRLIIMTKDVVLKDEEAPFKHGVAPYSAFYDYRVPHKFWGMGEPLHIEYLHKEYNVQLQAAVKHARLTENPNYIIDSSSGLDEEAVKDEFPQGGNMWSASMVNDMPIKAIEMGTLERTHMELLRLLPWAMEEVSGVTKLSKGEPSKKERQSASEVSILIESSYTRTRQKVRLLEWGVKRAAYQQLCLMQQYYDGARYFSYKEGNDEGTGLNFGLVGNSPNMLMESNTPEQISEEKDGEYAARLGTDKEYQQTKQLIQEVYHDVDPIYFKFDIEIQTNSTLPMDKQSLANLMLRLAEIQVGPNSIIDAEAVLKQLQIPDREAIEARKQKEKAQERQMQAGPPPQTGGPARTPMGAPPIGAGE